MSYQVDKKSVDGARKPKKKKTICFEIYKPIHVHTHLYPHTQKHEHILQGCTLVKHANVQNKIICLCSAPLDLWFLLLCLLLEDHQFPWQNEWHTERRNPDKKCSMLVLYNALHYFPPRFHVSWLKLLKHSVGNPADGPQKRNGLWRQHLHRAKSFLINWLPQENQFFTRTVRDFRPMERKIDD